MTQTSVERAISHADSAFSARGDTAITYALLAVVERLDTLIALQQQPTKIWEQ